MTGEQVGGIVRAVLMALVAFLAGKGIILPDATVSAIATGLVTLAIAAWSWHTNKPGKIT